MSTEAPNSRGDGRMRALTATTVQVAPLPLPASESVRLKFKRQRRRDTAPEIALRRELHSRGLRYRVDIAPTGTKHRADIVFTKQRVAVFVDGCFWHQCVQHRDVPRNNKEWWKKKLDRNVERDRQVDVALAVAGWTVLRIWEHEPVKRAADYIQETLRRSGKLSSARSIDQAPRYAD